MEPLKRRVMEIHKRLSEWKVILGPPWRWAVIAILTVLGCYQTIQQQWFSTLPGKLPFPPWAWFLIAVVVFFVVLEGAYRRIRDIRRKYGDLSAKLDIEVNHAEINSNGNIIVAFKLGRPSERMRVSEIVLNYNYRQVKGQIKNKIPRYIKNNTNYDVEFHFFENADYAKAWEMEERELFAYGQERHKATLGVNTDAGTWPSSDFVIPTELKQCQFVLKYDIGKKGDLTLKRDGDYYKMTLPITLKFTNLDTRYPISVAKYMRIGVDIFLRDGSKSTHILSNQDASAEIELKPGEIDRGIDYLLVGSGQFAQPEFIGRGCCCWNEVSVAHTKKYRQIPMRPLEPFDVEVKDITLQPTSHKGDSQS